MVNQPQVNSGKIYYCSLMNKQQQSESESENIDWTKYYELLDQSIHEYIEQLQLEPTEDDTVPMDVPQTPPADTTELNVAMSSAMADAIESNKRKRAWKANKGEVDGSRIKAGKLSYERTKGEKKGKMGLFEKLRLDLLGQRNKEKLKGRDIDIEIDTSLPVEKKYDTPCPQICRFLCRS